MRLKTAKQLHDAMSACQEMVLFCDGKTKDEFYRDRALNLVVHKLIEIVGEALHQAELLEPDIARHVPDLRLIVDTRNRITHSYESVDYGTLWDLVQTEVPKLGRTLADLLDNAIIEEGA